jgi:hypothetical protein
VAGVEDLRLAEGSALPVVPPVQAEFNKYANISAASAANWGGFLVIVEAVKVGTRGVRVGGEGVAELHVVHHRREDAGLVPGQPRQPVGELLVAEAKQSRLVGVVLVERVFLEAVDGARGWPWFDRLVVMTVLR